MRRVDEQVVITLGMSHFDEVIPILLHNGWTPKSIPEWLKKWLRVLLSKLHIDDRWKQFVGTVRYFTRYGTVIEDAGGPLMNHVLQVMMTTPPKDKAGVVKDLIAAGVSVNKEAAALAVEGCLFEVLGPLGDKLKEMGL